MVQRTDDLQDSITFFEQMLKENYGEFKFRKSMQVIEEFPGDIYLEKNEKKLVQKLSSKDLLGAIETA